VVAGEDLFNSADPATAPLYVIEKSARLQYLLPQGVMKKSLPLKWKRLLAWQWRKHSIDVSYALPKLRMLWQHE